MSEALAKGASDDELARYSRKREFVIVTYDDDFRDEFADDEYFGVLYFPDQTLSAENVADA